MIQALNSAIKQYPVINTNRVTAQAQARRSEGGFRMSGKRTEIVATLQSKQTKVVPDPLAIPAFLLNRIGCTWTRVQADLRLMVHSETEYHQILQGLLAFVETNVSGTAEQPRHGSGILIGLPLTSGWRRRLFVCPESDLLFWISS